MNVLVAIAWGFGGFLIIFIIVLFAKENDCLSNWSHGFEQFNFPVDEFYTLVSAAVEQKGIPDISISEVSHMETPYTLRWRKYLRLSWGRYCFDVCAAPFGPNYFVSWWFMERKRVYHRFFQKSAIFSALIGLKTYYQADTEGCSGH